MPATVAAIATPLISRPEGVEAFEKGAAGSGICSGATASREHNSAAARSPSKTPPRGFGFQGRTGISDAGIEGAAPTSPGVSFVGAFFGGSPFGSAFNGLPSSDRTGAPMIPSTLGLALPSLLACALHKACYFSYCIARIVSRKKLCLQKIVFRASELPGVDYAHTGSRCQPQTV